MVTTRAIIDVSDGRLVLRVGEEEVIFKISDALRHSLEQNDTCYFHDDFDITVFGSVQEVVDFDPLKACILQAKERKEDDLEIVKHFTYLEASGIMICKKRLKKWMTAKETI